MKIFILEDNSLRNKFFQKNLKEFDVTICNNYDDAIETINKEKFDIFFLDHDLDESIEKSGNRYKTGYDFAKYMEENKTPYKFIYIHTMNPSGARYMQSCFDEDLTKIIPFTILFTNIEYHKKDIKRFKLEEVFSYEGITLEKEAL